MQTESLTPEQEVDLVYWRSLAKLQEQQLDQYIERDVARVEDGFYRPCEITVKKSLMLALVAGIVGFLLGELL